MTAFAFIGSLIAYRRKRRDPNFDPFAVIVRWSVLGLIAGVIAAAAHARLT